MIGNGLIQNFVFQRFFNDKNIPNVVLHLGVLCGRKCLRKNTTATDLLNHLFKILYKWVLSSSLAVSTTSAYNLRLAKYRYHRVVPL
jgi:hypothetical protein